MCPKPFPSVLLLDVVALDRQRGTTVIVPNIYPYPAVCYLCSAHRHRLSTAACLPVHTAALDRRVRPSCRHLAARRCLEPLARRPAPYCLAGCIAHSAASPRSSAACQRPRRSPVSDVSLTALPPAPRSAAMQTSAARRCLEPLAHGMPVPACAPASGTVPLRPSQHRRSYGLDHTTALATVFCCAGVHFAARVLGLPSVSVAVQPACRTAQRMCYCSVRLPGLPSAIPSLPSAIPDVPIARRPSPRSPDEPVSTARPAC